MLLKNILPTAAIMAMALSGATAQTSPVRYGAEVPREVQVIYTRGLEFLAKSQEADGSWPSGDAGVRGGKGGTGITGMCLMAFLASGEDPNFGKYAGSVRKATRCIIAFQDPKTGWLPSCGYQHGFAMLALAEAYGQVNEELLWRGQPKTAKQRSIGQALELAVRCAVTGQSDQGGWRYNMGLDSDTSVSGAVLMGLLGARNAGIEVPDTCMEKALEYYRVGTDADGTVGYLSKGDKFDSYNRSAIAALVFAVGKKKDWKEYKATLKYSANDLTYVDRLYPCYYRYYIAQALFQGDVAAWSKWNRNTTDKLTELQQSDGSFDSKRHGPAYATSMSLVALALNYRFLPIYER